MSPTIIIAEDDADDCAFIEEALQRRHFDGNIRAVTNGVKLLTLLRQEKSSLAGAVVLLDLNMPLMDGYEALAQIRQDPELRSMPVAVLTSSTGPEEERRCFELGAHRFYRKPLSLEEYDRIAESFIGFLQSPGLV